MSPETSLPKHVTRATRFVSGPLVGSSSTDSGEKQHLPSLHPVLSPVSLGEFIQVTPVRMCATLSAAVERKKEGLHLERMCVSFWVTDLSCAERLSVLGSMK